MKTKAIHLSLSLLAVTGVNAQPSGKPEGHRPPPVPPLIAVLDADHDGTISAEEIQTAPAALAKLDTNSDGEITRDELRPPRPDGDGPPPEADGPPPEADGPPPEADGPPPEGDGPPPEGPQGPPPGGRPVPPLIAALDTDKNGTISAGEITAAPESLKALDKNNDGKLTPQEFGPRGPRPPRGEGPRGGRGPGGPPPMPGDEPPADAE